MNEIDKNKSIATAIGNSIKEIKSTKRNADNFSPLVPLSPEKNETSYGNKS